MTYQAICVHPDPHEHVRRGVEYTCQPTSTPGMVAIPGKTVLFSEARFRPLAAPQATAPAPTPDEAPVAPAEGLAGGVKHDDGKPRMDLLPPEALREIADVLALGAQKYDAHNWRKGFAYSRLLAAALRHVFSWAGGEDKDPESGKSHLAHAACCLMFLIAFEQTHTGTDDRYTSKEQP